MYTLPTNTTDEIIYFGNLIDEFTEGKIEPVKFKATRVPMGIYEQRKDGTYMVRIRCAGGFITPEQLQKVTEIATHHGSDLIHLTTRQEIQIQNVELKETIYILQNLKETDLSSKGGGGNTVRNIMASINSGITNNEVFDVTPYVFSLTSKLIAESDSFTLPRKLKIAFSNSEEDTAFAKFNDLGFIARIKDGKKGFGVYLGGSLASKPMVGYELFEFASEDDIYYIADAAKKLFSRYGNRKNKHKARLRYVFYKLGKDEVFRLFFEIYNEVKKAGGQDFILPEYSFNKSEPAIDPVKNSSTEFEIWKNRYATLQAQAGYYSVLIPFINGNSNAATLAKIAEFSANFGEDTIRFSMRQNLHLRNIPTKYLGNLYQLLTSLNFETEIPVLLNTIVACTGADTCRLGICLSKGANAALKKHLVKSPLNLDKLKDLRINISGCPNSCGQQISSDLGFFGKVARNDRMYPAYHVVAGAKTGNDAKLAQILGDISAYDLPKFTADVLQLYLEKVDVYPSFNAYVEAEGKEDITGLLAKYKNVPEFADDKNYYFDWGSDQIFSLAARGVGECSAGLFDMIEVDLATIQKSLARLDDHLNHQELNDTLYTLVFASSRMLLITRGEEPKTVTEVYNAFISKFIDSRVVSNIYKEIVETARDNHNFDFSSKRETITELAKTVIALYEGMDDSLQFKLKENAETGTPAIRQNNIRKKDFRGVACPMNFVKTKIELATLKKGDILEILLDDGEPIQNVPGSVRGEGHIVKEEKKIENYWLVVIEKN